MSWTVRIPRSVQRELDQLPDNVWKEAIATITELKEDPFPHGSIPLRGHTDLYRIKFYRDEHRIVYQVSEKQRRVIITRVRSRSAVYEGL